MQIRAILLKGHRYMKKRKIQKLIKKIMAAGLSIGVIVGEAVTFPKVLQVYAYTKSAQNPDDAGKTIAELNGYSNEEWTQLMDNSLEYSEIPELVHNFNPTIVSAWDSFNENIDSLSDIVDELKSAEKSARTSKENAEDSGDKSNIATYTMQEKIFDTAGDNMQDSLDKLKRSVTGTNRPIRQAEAQVVSGVRQLMIGYKSLLAQKETVSELVKMYDESYKAYQAMSLQGMATSTDVANALALLQSARASLSSIQASENQLYKQLIVMCGWSENASVNIGEIPSIDNATIDSLNPDADITKAIGNNYTLIEERHADKTHTLGAYESGISNSAQEEANLRANLNSQYQAVLSARQGYEAALAGYNGAQITKNGADTQYALGMLSKVQYLGASISYTQSKASLEAARLSLLQAVVTYQDMVDGNASVE